MTAVSLHSQEQIAAILRRNTALNLYALCDLDPFFWPHTLWYGLEADSDISEIVLMYTAFEVPILHAITANPAAMRDLLQSLLPLLPRKIYTHLSVGVLEALQDDYAVEDHGLHDKMLLTHPEALDTVDTSAVIALKPDNAAELRTLYAASNPDAWFDARMLETGCYYGVRDNGKLVSVAGVHVFSPQFGAAALGNVVTHPDFRGRGYARATCAKLCQSIRGEITDIGLNVFSTNAAALRVYTQLGFERVGSYGEYVLRLKKGHLVSQQANPSLP